MTTGMNRNPEVDGWFAAKQPPASASLQRVRAAILGADPRMTEYVKYGSVQFAFAGDMAAFVKTDRREVSLMFMRGGRIVGDFPHLEGTGRAVRFMRFADLAEADARADEVAAVTLAWCVAMEPEL